VAELIPQTKPSVRLRSDHLAAYLRADTIAHALIVGLARAWRDNGGAVMDAFDRLGEALEGDPSPQELAALIRAVEDTADEPASPQMTLTAEDAVRLHEDLTDVVRVLTRFNPGRAPARVRLQGGAAA